ncbi:MAG: ornithine carbamoyltransferase [Thermodesulfobacteriota bacterium]|nr:ornithine carbamoyltransferase [Thermodesulfobacteriota bacterium]
MLSNFKQKSFLKLLDFSPEEIHFLLKLAEDLKKAKYAGTEQKRLKRKNIALIFEKTSTRTRCAFETAAYDQGAHVTYLGPTGSQMGHKESMRDTARVLGRMYHGIEYRGFAQNKIEELAQYSGVPVWNGLTNEFHPTQVLADLLTIIEHTDKTLNEVSFAYLGDARNNMGNSLMIGAAKMGIDFRSISPEKLKTEMSIVKQAKKISTVTGAKIRITDDVEKGVKGCDFICTDVWVSMGEPENAWVQRIELLKPYQVSQSVMEMTGNNDVKFLHCLPAFHNRETLIGEKIYQKFGLEAMEVTDDVFESKASLVFDEAENRIHTAKAVMVATLGS